MANSYIKKFNYNGKDRECFVMREVISSVDEKKKVSEFDGFELTYLDKDEREAVVKFFENHEVKSELTKSDKAFEADENYNPAWMKKSWRHYKNVEFKDNE